MTKTGDPVKRSKTRLWKLLGNILTIGEANLKIFFIAMMLILGGVFFEVFGISMIIPLMNGLASDGNFLANMNVPYIGPPLRYLNFKSDFGIFIFFSAVILGSAWLSTTFLILSNFFTAKFLSDLGHNLRIKIFSRYLSFGKGFYDNNKTGALVSIMHDNVKELTYTLSSMRIPLVGIVMAIAFLFFLFMVSWRFSILAILLVILIYFPLTRLVAALKASATKQVSAGLELNSYLVDILSNILLVKSCSSEKAELERLSKKSDQLRFHVFNVFKKEAVVLQATDVIAATGLVVLAVLFTTISMKFKDFSLGRFIVYFYALMRFINYSKMASSIKAYLAKIYHIMERVSEIFDDSGKIFIKDGTDEFHGLKERVEFKNIDFYYEPSGKQILNDVTFNMASGSSVAIVGPTGAGKTTIANLLCRLYDPASGGIYIDGKDIRGFKIDSMHEKIAVVSQETTLLNGSIWSNIVYGMKTHVSRDMVDEAAKRSRLYDFIMSLPEKYDTLVGEHGVKLSGGEKQRISIARAILKNPEILILDEATSALDTETEMSIQTSLEDLMRGRTVLAIAHRLSTLRNSDWIIVLENGRITEEGRISELLDKKDRFFYYWNIQKFY